MADSTTANQAYRDVVQSTASDGLSPTIHVKGMRLTGYILPASWVGTRISAQVSRDGTTFYELKDSVTGLAWENYGAASGAYYLDPVVFASFPYVKLRAGLNGAASQQSADRTFVACLQRLFGN